MGVYEVDEARTILGAFLTKSEVRSSEEHFAQLHGLSVTDYFINVQKE
jgi:hypothetical protein